MLSGLKKVKGSIENIEFKNSDLGKRYYFYKDNYKDKINGLRKKIKNEKDDTERKKYERDLQEAQTEMVQALDRMN
jgi:predicted  nucleic acid-binding Zn-ribbon protein